MQARVQANSAAQQAAQQLRDQANSAAQQLSQEATEAATKVTAFLEETAKPVALPRFEASDGKGILLIWTFRSHPLVRLHGAPSTGS